MHLDYLSWKIKHKHTQSEKGQLFMAGGVGRDFKGKETGSHKSAVTKIWCPFTPQSSFIAPRSPAFSPSPPEKDQSYLSKCPLEKKRHRNVFITEYVAGRAAVCGATADTPKDPGSWSRTTRQHWVYKEPLICSHSRGEKPAAPEPHVALHPPHSASCQPKPRVTHKERTFKHKESRIDWSGYLFYATALQICTELDYL